MKMKKQKRSLRKSPKTARRSRRKNDDELKELEYYQLLKLLIAQGVEQIPGSPMFIEGWWPGKEKKSPKRNRRRW